MLRRYNGRTEALIQGYAASAATVAISACDVIRCESGGLCCYHNPVSTAEGDYRDMSGASKSLKNARDTILDAYLARPVCKTTREELAALMDKDIFITPTQAKEYGLIDEIVTLEGVTEPEGDPAAFVAAAGRIRLTAAMREQYRRHVAEDREAAARDCEAKRILARLGTLAKY